MSFLDLDFLKTDLEKIDEVSYSGDLAQAPSSAYIQIPEGLNPDFDRQKQIDPNVSWTDGFMMHHLSWVKAPIVFAAKQLVNKEDGYSPFDDELVTSRGKDFMVQYADELVDSPNRNWTKGMLLQIDKNEKIKQGLPTWKLITSQLASGIFDPLAMIPFVGIAGKGNNVAKITSAVMQNAALSGAQEFTNQYVDPTQTTEETIQNTAFATILGGAIIGGLGIRAGMDADLFNNVSDHITGSKLSEGIDPTVINNSMAESVGAAANPMLKEAEKNTELLFTNSISDTIHKVTSLYSVEAKLARSENAAVRELNNILTSHGFIQKGDLKLSGRADSIQSLYETRIHNDSQSIVNTLNDSFAKAKMVDKNLNRQDFLREVEAYGRGVHPMFFDNSPSTAVVDSANAIKKMFNDFVPTVKNSGKVPEDWVPDTNYWHTAYDFDQLSNNYTETLTDIKTQLNKQAQNVIEDNPELASDLTENLDITAQTIYENMLLRASGKTYTPKFTTSALKKVTLNFDNEFKFKYSSKDTFGTIRGYIEDMSREDALFNSLGKGDFFLNASERVKAGAERQIADLNKKPMVPAERDVAVKKILDAAKSDQEDIKKLLEIHTRQFGKDTPKFLKDMAAISTGTNFLLRMGMNALAQVSDFARLVGLSPKGRALTTDLQEFTNGIGDIIKLSPTEGLRLGIISDRLTGFGGALDRASTRFDDIDIGSVTKTQAAVNVATNAYSKAVLISHMNDFTRKYASECIISNMLDTAAKISKGKLSPTNIQSIQFSKMGFNADDAAVMLEQFNKHKTVVKDSLGRKVVYTNFDDWDALPKAQFMSRVKRAVDLAIMTPTVGSKPFFLSTAQGRIIGQFLSFTFASGSKLLATDAQQAYGFGLTQSNIVARRMVADMALGALSGYLKDFVSGRDLEFSSEKTLNYALERSGVLAMAMFPSQLMDRFGYGIASALGVRKSSRSGGYDTSRAILSLGGPTATLLADTTSVIKRLSDGTATDSDMRAAFRLLPGNNAIYFNWLIANYGK